MMSFNLNKNDVPNNLGNSKKINTISKFDLSKSDMQATEEIPKKKPKSWLALLGILFLGIIFFFLFNSGGNPSDTNIVIERKNDLNPEIISKEKSNLQLQDSSELSDLPIIENSTAIPEHLNNKIPALFNSASAKIQNIDKTLASQIIEYLNANKNASLTINGYASSEGHLSKNQKISQARANAFKNYLVKNGISKNRIHSVGKGIENPIASNDSEDGRRKNRRVEIFFEN